MNLGSGKATVCYCVELAQTALLLLICKRGHATALTSGVNLSKPLAQP